MATQADKDAAVAGFSRANFQPVIDRFGFDKFDIFDNRASIGFAKGAGGAPMTFSQQVGENIEDFMARLNNNFNLNHFAKTNKLGSVGNPVPGDFNDLPFPPGSPDGTNTDGSSSTGGGPRGKSFVDTSGVTGGANQQSNAPPSSGTQPFDQAGFAQQINQLFQSFGLPQGFGDQFSQLLSGMFGGGQQGNSNIPGLPTLQGGAGQNSQFNQNPFPFGSRQFQPPLKW